MRQKVIQIGSSAGVTIPKERLSELGLKIGDFVTTRVENGVLLVEPAEVKPPQKSQELAAWLEDAVERYRPALEALKRA